MDRQLAERMVGAACLLAVLVLVVPAVLDGNQEPASTGPEPVLPEVRDLRRHTLSLDSEERVPPVPVLPDRPGEAAGTLPEDDVPAAVVAAVELPDTTPAAAVAAPAAEQSAAAAHASADKAVAATPVAAAPAPAAPAPSADAQAPSDAGQWYVQLGVFSNRQNAEGLKKKLVAAGFEATIRKSNRGLRVLVGPRTDREAAVALAGKLKAAGHTGQLTRL